VPQPTTLPIHVQDESQKEFRIQDTELSNEKTRQYPAPQHNNTNKPPEKNHIQHLQKYNKITYINLHLTKENTKILN
jgi:hypothetical protein